MTVEQLSEIVGKMNEACEGKIKFSYHYSAASPDKLWIGKVVPSGGREAFLRRGQYSPKLNICELSDWCEAWLKGFAEAKAAYESGSE